MTSPISSPKKIGCGSFCRCLCSPATHEGEDVIAMFFLVASSVCTIPGCLSPSMVRMVRNNVSADRNVENINIIVKSMCVVLHVACNMGTWVQSPTLSAKFWTRPVPQRTSTPFINHFSFPSQATTSSRFGCILFI